MKTSKFAVSAWLACLFCSAALPQAPLPSVLDYVKNPDFDSARISPDGAHIALLVPKEDTEALMILDAATMQTKAAFETLRNNGILRYWWANDERIVFTTSINVGGSDQASLTGDVYGLNVDDTQKFLLAGPSSGEAFAYDVLDTMENDREHIMVQRWPIRKNSISRSPPEVIELDIYQPPARGGGRISSERRTTSIHSPLPWGNLVTDNAAEVRMAYAVNDDGKLQVKLRTDGEWKDVASFLGASEDLVMPSLGQPLGFNADNTGIYHLARSPQGTIGVSLYNIAAGQSNLLYAHERYDVTNGDLVLSADGKDLIGVIVMGALPETHYFGDHADEGFHRSIDKSLPSYRINFLNFTSDQRKGLAMVSAPTMPPGLFLLDRDKGAFTPLYSSRPRLQGAPMTKAEPLSLTARDGTPIEGYLTRAVGVEGAAPLIVLVHGGPHSVRDIPVFNTEVKLLASRGYSVLQVNYRGSGGYGVAFEALGYRRWGKEMIDDIIDATQYAVAEGAATNDRICIMGASYGGYAAMMALERYPDQFKCGVGISGVYDLNLMKKSDVPFLPGGAAYISQVLGDDEDELAANSPVTLAANIKVPVFLAHGGQDRRAPPKNAERFKDALDDAGASYQWFYVRTAGHGFAQPENRENLYNELLTFLSTNL